MPYCVKCGNKLKKNTIFCDRCSTKAIYILQNKNYKKISGHIYVKPIKESKKTSSRWKKTIDITKKIKKKKKK